ncbi:GerAB/ArcD/ProY family transporter [Paenibacillus soyae]|uniref:Spore germination protein n=1 Tax=Paenibacillus soyae TaxID=2969249 RepID=A0A9X2S9Z1_9BACL|nr:spore germination protein [Paenibacillus soyae]MCR2805671.1 spore germination protein [Paenibacillus soyae]
MMKATEKITALQATALLMLAIMPTGLLYLPAIVTKIAAQDAWISVLVSLLLGLGLAFYIGYLTLQNPGMSFIRWIESRLGRIAALIIGLFLTKYYVSVSAVALQEFSTFIADEILQRTPVFIIVSIVMIVVLYAVYHGLETIARVTLIVFFLNVVLTFIGLLLLGKDLHFAYLLPVGEKPVPVILKGSISPFIWLTEVAVLLIIGPFLNKKQYLMRTSVTGVLLAGTWNVLLVMLAILIFGPKLVQLVAYPSFAVVSLVEIGNFLERLEIVFISLWITTMYVKIALFMFAASHCLNDLFRIENKLPIQLGLGLFTLMTALYSWDNTADFSEFMRLAGPPHLFLANIAIPLLLGIALWFMKRTAHRRGEQNDG